MEPVIRGKNVEISEKSRGYILRKLERLNRHLNSIGEARVDVTMEDTRSQQERIVAQVTLNCNGTLLRGQERAATITAAIDAVAEVMDRRVGRLKGKLYRSEQAKRSAKVSAVREVDIPPSPDEEDEDTPEAQGIARVKRFSMKPMTVGEAMHQMELLGHDFFFFFNSNKGEYNVLYRRMDEGYGLLEPDLL